MLRLWKNDLTSDLINDLSGQFPGEFVVSVAELLELIDSSRKRFFQSVPSRALSSYSNMAASVSKRNKQDGNIHHTRFKDSEL